MRNFYQSDCPRCGRPQNETAHREKGCPMTREMWDALLAYRKANGYRWKSMLTAAWTADDPSVTYVRGLVQVRNIVGPTGLYKLKFPRESRSAAN